MSIFAPLGWAALLTWPVPIPFLVRRRFILGLAVWPAAAVTCITLPVMLDPLLGWMRTAWRIETLAVAVILALVVELAIRIPGPAASSPAVTVPMTVSPFRGRTDWLSLAGALLLVGWVAGVLVLSARWFPLWEWDAYGIWVFKAKIIAGLPRLPMQAFTSLELGYSHANYPLAFPSALAWAIVIGKLDFQTVRTALGIGFAALGLGVYFGVRSVAGATASLLSVIVMLALLAVHPDLTGGMADPWYGLAGMAGMALALGGMWRHDRMLLAAAGLPLAAAALTKNEGLAVAMVINLSLLLFPGVRPGASRHTLLEALRPALVWLLPVLVWKLVLARFGVHSDLELESSLGRFFANRARLGPIFAAMKPYLLALPMLALYAFLAGALLLALRRRAQPGPRWFVFAVPPAGMLGALIFVYVVTPHDLAWHLGTSLYRTIRFPLAAAFLATILALDARGRPPSNTSGFTK